MHWDANWHAGWFLGMHLLWWAFWIAVTVGLWWAFARSAARPSQNAAAEAPLELLRRRYAAGALTTAEFEERRAKLMEPGAPTPH